MHWAILVSEQTYYTRLRMNETELPEMLRVVVFDVAVFWSAAASLPLW